MSLSSSSVTTPRGTFARYLPVPIRVLDASYRPQLLAHLLALESQDRYLRFGYAATDAHIERYVEGLDFERDLIMGVQDAQMQLIAMAHLALAAGAEFGVSVLPHARGAGLGSRLFERACAEARNAGVHSLLIYALRENTAMLKIARNAGAEVQYQGGETESLLALPRRTLRTRLGLRVARGWAGLYYSWRRQWRQLYRSLRAGSRTAG